MARPTSAPSTVLYTGATRPPRAGAVGNLRTRETRNSVPPTVRYDRRDETAKRRTVRHLDIPEAR